MINYKKENIIAISIIVLVVIIALWVGLDRYIENSNQTKVIKSMKYTIKCDDIRVYGVSFRTHKTFRSIKYSPREPRLIYFDKDKIMYVFKLEKVVILDEHWKKVREDLIKD